MMSVMRLWSFVVLAVAWTMPAGAETGRDAWLRYAPLARGSAPDLPAVIVAAGDSPLMRSARSEIVRGVRGMTGKTLRVESRLPVESAIVVGAAEDLRRSFPQLTIAIPSQPESFHIQTIVAGPARDVVIAGADARGALYGAFDLLRRIGTGEWTPMTDVTEAPRVAARWINQWDNLRGTIERGYGGPSMFWENGSARADLTRAGEYGRLLASIGINACAIDNVNADPRLLTDDYIPQIARIAEAFRPWGVRVVLSIDFGSPQSVGGLKTFDPLDPAVASWWKERTDALYRAIPDLAGFVLKADSEGRVGPSAYGRTHADAANVVARALAPHAGLVFYRGFVYNHHMDWNDPKNDRARAAYDNFKPLDGKFDANVFVQIKNGPIDFQVREPASPLFGALPHTNEALELQITQEYLGQARHTVFLAPQWKETLDFDMHAGENGTPVKSLVRAWAGVANAGMDENWLGNHLSQANLYAFGRLAWNPDLSAKRIADEWTALTFSANPTVVKTISSLQLSSWKTYEDYTGPLGLQTLTDIVGNHYGVAVEASERNGWGQWHRADEHGVGMDRTTATGTGYIGQYAPQIAKTWEDSATCPDDLLLFLHHVPYTYRLHDGSSVIQYLYDSHYRGAAQVEEYVRDWRALKGLIDDQRYQDVLSQLEYQAGQATVWRDAVTTWFHRASGITDDKGRVGYYPGRVEAESMKLAGYAPVGVKPWETASGGKAVACRQPHCEASFGYAGAPGWYTLRLEYFDQRNGASHYRVFVGDQLIDQWVADDQLPTTKLDGTSSKRRKIPGIALRPGDVIRIEGAPDGGESAALDYVELISQ
jgi:alpha-glucuronidase